MKTRFMLATSLLLQATAVSAKTDLHVAVFAYTPDAANAIEQFEDVFEAQHPEIDLDLTLWNPYSDIFKDKQRGFEQIQQFDLVEIDTCRLTELVAGGFGGLDEIPAACRPPVEIFVGPARELAGSTLGSYVLPHWCCGNFVFSWKKQHPNGVTSYEQLLSATASSEGNPLYALLSGKSNLGSLYFDALIDAGDTAAAQRHLLELFGKETVTEADLDKEAVAKILALKDKLPPEVAANLGHFDNHPYVLPRWFATKPASVLIAFSEGIYFAERELQLTPGKYAPVIKPEEINVQELPLAAESKGMPAWVDAFVIPKGKLETNREAISSFLKFAASKEGFLPFIEPQMYLAPTYLLPSVKAFYELPDSVEKQPLLPLFMQELERATPISDHRTWQGMRKAGKVLETLLEQP